MPSGRWYCFGCHEGGDLISFVQKKHGLRFRDAAKYLGLTDDSHENAAEINSRRRASLEAQAARAAAREQERSKRIAARDYLHNLERHYREISEELSELSRQGIDNEKSESCWTCLALLTDAIREGEDEYFRLCGLKQEPS